MLAQPVACADGSGGRSLLDRARYIDGGAPGRPRRGLYASVFMSDDGAGHRLCDGVRFGGIVAGLFADLAPRRLGLDNAAKHYREHQHSLWSPWRMRAAPPEQQHQRQGAQRPECNWVLAESRRRGQRASPRGVLVLGFGSFAPTVGSVATVSMREIAFQELVNGAQLLSPTQ